MTRQEVQKAAQELQTREKRIADEAWNAAIEAAAQRLEARAMECWGGATVTCGMMRGVYSEEVKQLRALKREAE